MTPYDRRLVNEIQYEVDRLGDGLQVFLRHQDKPFDSVRSFSLHLHKLLEIVRLVAMPPEDGGTDRMDAQAMRSLRAVIRGDCSEFTERDGEGFNLALIRFIGQLRAEKDQLAEEARVADERGSDE
jgi:hypothetical protein